MFGIDKEGRMPIQNYHLGYSNSSTEMSFFSISFRYSIHGFFEVKQTSLSHIPQTISSYCRDDRFLITIGNYRKPMLTLWSTTDYSHLLNWQNDFTSSHINCLAWNPLRSNEFSLGSSHNSIHFCTINEQSDNSNIRLQVIKGEIPVLLNEHSKSSSDITTCVYLTSNLNLVLCATNYGYVTCWNSRLALCILHWKADTNEISYLSTMNNKLITGSSIGCLKLWNIQSLEASSTDTFVFPFTGTISYENSSFSETMVWPLKMNFN